MLAVPLWYNSYLSPHVHHPCKHILGISHWWFLKKKNFNISMEVSLLEKQKWLYNGDPLGKIPIVFRQGW